MYRSFLLVSALASAFAANAQQTVHQVMVLNEGHYDFGSGLQDVPVTLGSYDPVSGTYHTVATIPDARFGNHVLVNEGVVYVAADSFLLKYDADTYALFGSTVITGVRRFAIWNDQLIVTRGETGGLDHYVDVLDKHTLQPIYHVSTTDLPYSCEGIQVVGDKAYFAVNNAFEWGNTVGKVGVLDLATQTFESSIDLGPDGMNPENLMVDGDALYTFNNKDFNSSSVSRIDLVGDALDHTDNVALNSSCASSEYNEHDVYYLEYAVGRIARFDVVTRSVHDTLPTSPNAYGLLNDPIDGVMYATTTDYVTSGELHVMDAEGHVLNTVAVGVAPGSMALDVRTSTGIAEEATASLKLYPNPADGEVFLQVPASTGPARILILDATGRVVRDEQRTLAADARFDVSAFAPGVYTVRMGEGTVARFTKR